MLGLETAMSMAFALARGRVSGQIRSGLDVISSRGQVEWHGSEEKRAGQA
jgi:hypothetical protein